MNKNLIIIGTGSTAKIVSLFVERYKLFNLLGFAVNESYINERTFCGKPVYAIENLDDIIDKENDFLFVAIQWNRLNADRKKVYLTLKQAGYKFANLIAPNAIVKGDLVGDNSWISDLVFIDVCSTIGANCFIKSSAIILDNCVISDHCFIAAKSLVAGGCKVGEQSFIGLNATLFDDTVVGKKCIVGACTAVKRNLPDYSKITTSLDSFNIKQYTEEEIEFKLISELNVRK